MHAIADRLDVPKLVTAAHKNYSLAQARLDQTGNLEGFVQSVRVVYTTTSSTDRRLRDIALFAIQWDLAYLHKSENEEDDDEEDKLIRELLASTPQYALELLTIDVSYIHTWCQRCRRKYAHTATTCACGMRGICGDMDCTNGDWSNIECSMCEHVGSCRKAAPEDPRPWRTNSVE